MMFRMLVLLSLALIVAACQPAEVLPTLAPSPTLEPTATETPEPTPTRPASPTPEPTTVRVRTDAFDPRDQSYIRVANAAADEATIDVYVEELNIASGIAPTQYTEPSGIVAGTFVVRVVPVGGRPSDGAILSQEIAISGQKSLLLLFRGTLAAPELLVLEEDTSPLNSNEFRITVIHTMTNAGAISVTDDRGNVLAQDLAPGAVSAAQVVPAGNTQIAVSDLGGVLMEPRQRWRERTNLLLVLTGDASVRSTLRLLPLEQQVPGLARIRFVHASNPLSSMDLYAGEISVASSVPYLAGTEYITLPSGSYPLTLRFPQDDPDSAPLIEDDIFLSADDSVTVLLVGDTSAFRLVTQFERANPTSNGQARIRFAHTVPDLPRVTLDSTNINLQMLYGQFSDSFEIPAGTHSFTWTAPGEDEAVQTYETGYDLILAAGASYLYLFAARDTASPVLLVEIVGEEAIEPELEASPTPAPTGIPASRIRAINAVPALSVDFRLDEVTIGSGWDFASTTPPLVVSMGTHILTAHSISDGRLLARAIVEVEAGTEYSVYFSGNPDGYQLDIAESAPLPVAAGPLLRLVNLNQRSEVLGLALGPQGTSTALQGGTSEGGEATGPSRPTLPFGVERIVNEVEAYRASAFVAATSSPNLRDVLITDPRQGAMAFALGDIVFNTGSAYDIIVITPPGSREPSAFIVPYAIP